MGIFDDKLRPQMLSVGTTANAALAIVESGVKPHNHKYLTL